MSEYYDTYFLNSKRALKIAKQKNKVKLYNGFGTQICYYSGDKINTTHINLIHLPLESIKSFFSQNSYRLPSYIDFNKSSYEDNDELQVKYKNIILNIFKEMEASENIKNEALLKELKQNNNSILNHKKINFVIIVSRTLAYDYFYAKQLKKSLKKLGHCVNILTEEGSTKVLINNLKSSFIFKNIINIKPNVVIFINDYKPEIITKDKYQISIISGFLSLLKTIHKNNIREKDILISQNQYINKILENKNIPIQYVPPTIKAKKNLSTSTEKKYVLTIFSNYFDLDSYIVFQSMVKKLFKEIKHEVLTVEKIRDYINTDDYENKNDYEMISYLQKNIILQSCIKWLSTNKTEIQLIGENWDTYKKFPSNIKIKKEKNPLKTYGKSKYVLHISPNIIDVNLLSTLQSGAIPIVYDLRHEDKNYNKEFDKYCLFFKKKEELNEILNNTLEPKKLDSGQLLDAYSFDSLSNNIVNLIINNNDAK